MGGAHTKRLYISDDFLNARAAPKGGQAERAREGLYLYPDTAFYFSDPPPASPAETTPPCYLTATPWNQSWGLTLWWLGIRVAGLCAGMMVVSEYHRVGEG